ncbi:Short stop [Strongyloides ratti]|uniref:Short stop n=1 Tax=Strongyloides ratti TaxID=34506 RepID=A0A090MZK3_STRRB|nr:Short stop [Strongyloides ratti]CEF69084.1 Short stop [Strongyloides ratti]
MSKNCSSYNQNITSIEDNREKLADERAAIQKKTFTKWVNSHLNKNGYSIENLFMDLRDGIHLAHLIDILTNSSLLKSTGRTPFHALQNITGCLEHLKNYGVKLVNIRTEDIHEGNPKLTLGLIWTLILHFELSFIKTKIDQTSCIDKIKSKNNDSKVDNNNQLDKENISNTNNDKEAITVRGALLRWAQQSLGDYSKLIPVINFTSSWKDGKAFCGIISNQNSKALPKDLWFNDNFTSKQRLKLAFDTANKLYNVPCLLDPEDVDCENPDDKSIITYLSLLCHNLSFKTTEDFSTIDDKTKDKTNKYTDEFFNIVNSFKDKPSTIKTDLLKNELDEHTKLLETMESKKQEFVLNVLSYDEENVSPETSEHIKKANDFIEKSFDFAKTRLYELQEAFELCDTLNENTKSLNEWFDSFLKSMNELKESIPDCSTQDIDVYAKELENHCENIKRQSDFWNAVMERVDKFFEDHDNQNMLSEINCTRSNLNKRFEDAWEILNKLAEEFDEKKVEQLHESFGVVDVSSDNRDTEDVKIFNEKVNQMNFYIMELETIMNRLQPIVGISLDQMQSELSEINDTLVEMDEKTFIMKELRKHLDDIKNNDINLIHMYEGQLLFNLESRWKNLTSFFKTRSNELDNVLLKRGDFIQVINETINWIDSIQKCIDEEDVKYADVKIIDLEICRLNVLEDDIKSHGESIDEIKKSLPSQMYLINEVVKIVTEMSDKYNNLKTSWNNKYHELEFMKEEALSILKMFEDIKKELLKFEQKLMLPQPLPAMEKNVILEKKKFDQLYDEFNEYKKISTIKESLEKSETDPRAWYKNNVSLLNEQITKLEKDFEEKKLKLEKALEHGKEITKTINSLETFVENAEDFIENINTESRSLQILSQELTLFDEFLNDLNSHRKTFKYLEKLAEDAIAICDKKDAITLKNDIVKIGRKMEKIEKKKQEKYGILKTKQTDITSFYDSLSYEVGWIGDTMVTLSNISLVGKDSNEIKDLVEKCKAFRMEIKNHSDLINKLHNKGLELESEALTNEKKSYRNDVDKLFSLWDELKELADKKYQELQEILNKKEEYNNKINNYLMWCENYIKLLENDINEGNFLGDIESILELEKEHAFLQSDFKTHESFIEDELINLKNTPNDIKLLQLDENWKKLKCLISNKENELMYAKEKAFLLDEKSKNLHKFLNDANDKISSLNKHTDNIMKEQIEVFKILGTQINEKKEDFNEINNTIKEYLPKASLTGKKNLTKMLEDLSYKWNDTILKKDEKQCICESELETFEELKKSINDNRKMVDEYVVELNKLDNPKNITFIDDHEFAYQQYLLVKSDMENQRCLINGLFEKIDNVTDSCIGKEFLIEEKNKLLKEWLSVQQKSFEYGEALSNAKNDIIESNNLSNFTFTEWRNRYIKWHDLGKLRINDLFRNFDDKGTGYLSREEIISPFLLSSFPTNKKEMEKVADVFDEGKNKINVKKFLQALKVPSDKTSALKTEKEIIEKEIMIQSQQCKCTEKYKIKKISTSEDGVTYNFGNDGGFKRFIRILQFSIMVRVGGGWVTLEKFLETHDPCRMDRKTNLEIYGIGKKLPHTVGRMENFQQKRHNSHSIISSSNRSSDDNTPIRRPLSRQISKIPVFTKSTN